MTVPRLPFKKTKTFRSGRLFWIIPLFLLILVGGGLWWGTEAVASRYANRLFPGLRIGALDLGGKTFEEAQILLSNRLDQILTEGMLITAAEKTVVLPSAIFSPDDPDLSRELVRIDHQDAWQKIQKIGHGSSRLANFFTYVRQSLRPTALTLPVQLDTNEIESLLEERFSTLLAPATNARFDIQWQPDANGPIINVLPEKDGVFFDRAELQRQLYQEFGALESPRVTLAILPDHPQISFREAERLVPQVKELFDRGPWLVHFDSVAFPEGLEWKITPTMLASMLDLYRFENQIVYLKLADNLVLENFFREIESVVNRPPTNAKFSLENGKVVEFQSSQNGLELDRVITKEWIELMLFGKLNNDTVIMVREIEPETTTAEVNAFGIKEVLGVGISNFRGSPANRIKNIKNGARLLNGTLIKPDEEFSLLGALAPFTAENGYLPELVIKGDRIEPEIGGGLCQLGTTTFRAAMKSGLPITMRQNHSLVVSYYNDPQNGNPGTDATIYDPSPDFRFGNDTGSHILITTEVDLEKKELRFTFWGASDGRKGDYSAPVVDRWIPAGEPRTIETTDLAPGEKKCQSRHPGADAHFTYTVIWPDGRKEETTYTSHYRPLPEICLVGVEEKTSTETETETENLNPDEAADAAAP
ncbi:VanW family protein [Candidatus Uhrbacteria bacterium]|nr:VanW family protein [Candidatus Uhrbacteria bacterium]